MIPVPAVEDTWRLEDIFATEDAFLEAKREVEETLPALADLTGVLARGAGELAVVLESISGVSRQLGRLHAYASMRSDGDLRIAAHQALRQEVELAYTELSRRTAWLRPEILALKAYSHASWDPAFDRLHANELPWRAETDRTQSGLNRYPEPHPHELAACLAALYGVPAENLLPGRGSDESIDLVVRAFCRAGIDNVILCPPTFGMYKVAAQIQGAAVREVPLTKDRGYALDVDGVLAACDANTKIVFLCSPNNPTGNAMDPAAVERLLTTLAARALVVVDEAYIEFSGATSLAASLAQHPNLVVLRTLSKAFGLAGARVGSLIAATPIVQLLEKVIPPYSIPQLTIEAVLATLAAPQVIIQRERVAQVRAERDRVADALSAKSSVRRVWPSVANFLLVDFSDPEATLAAARDAKLLIRDMRAAAGALRISVGTPEQNNRLIRSIS